MRKKSLSHQRRLIISIDYRRNTWRNRIFYDFVNAFTLTMDNLYIMYCGKKAALIADKFVGSSRVESIIPYGSGNINDTFLVCCDRDVDAKFILQRLNGLVFLRPELVVENMLVVSSHVKVRIAAQKTISSERWQIPAPLQNKQGDYFVCDDYGGLWRAMTFLEQAVSFDEVQTKKHAFEAGRSLGKMHELLRDLDPAALSLVIPGFHETQFYLKRYNDIIANFSGPMSGKEKKCHDFIKSHQGIAGVLPKACQDGELCLRPIHGDPKIANIMVDPDSHVAVGMVDLDTVGPGLIQYDIGDCLRSCCNPAGEESGAIDEVEFDLDLCETIMVGYFSEAARFVTKQDRVYFFDGLRVITYELGLRFFMDHLEGSTYFKVKKTGHNLNRALRQFRLFKKIVAKEAELRKLFLA